MNRESVEMIALEENDFCEGFFKFINTLLAK